MSNIRRVVSPSQPSTEKSTPETKKVLQRRTKGTKGVKKDQITKYLVKDEKDQADTHPTLADHPPPTSSSSQETLCDVSTSTSSMTSTRPAEAVQESSSTSGTTTNTQPNPSKKTTKEGRQLRERGKSKKKSEKEGSGGSISGGGGDRRGVRQHSQQEQQQQENRGDRSSKSGQRGKKVFSVKDGDYVPERRQIQSSIRDHFPVRRSGRKSKSELEKEAFERTAQRLRDKDESGLKVVDVEGKGRGIVSTRPFSRGELVCEYSGELISHEDAKKREEEYCRDPSIGCYMYYFSYKNSKLCVDATTDNGRKGRLLNHSRTSANVVTKLLEVDDHPYLCLVAGKDITVGEQLEYDYGERDKETMDSHPWLAT